MTTVSELDLQEQTRRDDVYNDLNNIVDQLTALPVFPSLMWVWSFDIIRNIFEEHQFGTEWDDYSIKDNVTLKDIFDKFWEDVDSLGINMDFGGEVVEETIRDWMIDREFLAMVEEEDEDEDE